MLITTMPHGKRQVKSRGLVLDSRAFNRKSDDPGKWSVNFKKRAGRTE